MAVKEVKKSKIKIRLNSYDHRIIDLSCGKIVDVAVRTGASVTGPVPLPTRIEKYTVIRGPHIDALSHLSLPAGVGISIKV